MIYSSVSLSFTETACIMLFHRFSSFVKKENLNFAVYCMIDTHINKFSKKLNLKVSYTSFLIAGIHCIPLGLESLRVMPSATQGHQY